MIHVTGNLQGKVWGKTQLVFLGNNVEVHRIHAKKGFFCSRHKHVGKYNLFFVESGQILIRTTKDGLDDESILGPGQTCVVKPGDLHQFEALKESWVLEIYYATLDPDDIVRESQGGQRIAQRRRRKAG